MFLMPSQIRAVRPEPDVQHALRHRAGRPARSAGWRTRFATTRAGAPDATGFAFDEYTPAALLEALGRALALFQDPPAWRALQLAGMRQDHSWDRSAREYVKIYERAMNRGPAGPRPSCAVTRGDG